MAIGLKLLFFWLATAAVVKRLHDLGMGAWILAQVAAWVIVWSTVVSAALMVVLGAGSLQVGGIGYWISIGATTAPVFGLILWLHCAPGMVGTNQFGP